MNRILILVCFLLYAGTTVSACPEIHRTKNLATKYSFDIDSVLTGNAIVSPTGLDCESRGYSDSVNPGAFADVAGTEVTDATSTDANYIPLSAAEVNFDLIDIRCKSTSTNAVTNCATINTMVNLTQIDGQATTGNNATLNLKQLNINNSVGDAIVATSSGSNGRGIVSTGNGSGASVRFDAGATGVGLDVRSTSGNAVLFLAGGGGGSGFAVSGQGSGSGLLATGGATGVGIKGAGGATSGAGFAATSTTGDTITSVASAGNGNAIKLTGQGSGAGLSLVPGATGNGLLVIGGATSGSAVKATGTAGNAIALELAGQGSAAGLSATGGATGNGIAGVGGATSGDGFDGSATSGFGYDGTQNGNITGNLSGSVGSVIGAIGSIGTGGIVAASFSSGSIDAAAIATDAIGAVEIAANAIGASELATDSITSDELATSALAEFITTNSGTTSASAVQGSVAQETADLVATGGAVTISAGGITAASFASGSITADALGTDVIGHQKTAQAVTVNTLQMAAAETYGDNALARHDSILITNSTNGIWQIRCIKSNVAATDTVTFTLPLKILPTGTVKYAVIPTPNCDLSLFPVGR